MHTKASFKVLAGSWLLLAALAVVVQAQSASDYVVDSEWAKLPNGGAWDGSTSWITADGRGNIVVLVRTAPYFRMFKRDGTFVKAWSAKTEIANAHSLTIDKENNYWVTDSVSHQVLKMNAQGDVLLALGSKGKAGDNTSRDLFNQPNHVAIAPNGDIYISDGYVNARVVQFAPDGKFVRIIGGEKGGAPGQLQVPHGVAIDSKGRILVNDSDNARVSVFDPNGKFLETWPYPSRGGLEVAADDTVYVSDVNAGVINVSRNGKHIATYQAPRPHGLAVDTDGSIYASGASRMTVMKILKKK
jgi:sugar lactone lactonase YvrE